ncbi:MAG: HD domain-containing protein [Microscillaceae bacterium]|jgi:guanosine-3',5'-bis(diphosphate) 3'-pyrophosphohydrolase|nr:HD domain-containing protein [Microscillaceae bacterium]
MFWNEEIYRQTITFAAKAHADQKIAGTNLPYLTHLASVAMETASAFAHTSAPTWNIDFALQCALLHDTLEDTPTHYGELVAEFGESVAQGVLALTKNTQLPYDQQMSDSLDRILQQPIEIRIVKMADRVDNLYLPAIYWTPRKRRIYQEEAHLILQTLGGANEYIETRLQAKITDYAKFF